MISLYYDDVSDVFVFSDKSVSGLKSNIVDSMCAGLPGWLSWLCPKKSNLSESLKNMTFDGLYISKIGSKESFGVQKERCDCIGCSKVKSVDFKYKGYVESDLNSVLGFVQVTSSGSYVISPQTDGVSLQIKNPVDPVAAWQSLLFVK